MSTPAHDLGESAVHDFLSPRDVRIGDGAAAHVGDILTRWEVPGGDVLVVCDGALPSLGHLDPVLRSLEGAGYTPQLHDKVTSEPDVSMGREVVSLARSRAFQAILGVGGGSSMDLAKIAAALAGLDGDLLEYVGTELVTGTTLPLVLIPTTAGTGAEATRIAMISHKGEKQIINDAKLVPLAAVLDPRLVASLPEPVTASTGMDALSHAMESIISTSATPLTQRVGLEAVELLSAGVPAAYHDGDNMQARQGTLYGAYLAGLGLNAGVVLGHSIAYTIANRVHLPHGVTAAMALPYCLAYAQPASGERIDWIFTKVRGADPSDTLFSWLAQLNTKLDVPQSLQAVGLEQDEVEAMAAECVERYPRPSNPVPLEHDRVRVLYRHLWTGDLDGCVEALAKS